MPLNTVSIGNHLYLLVFRASTRLFESGPCPEENGEMSMNRTAVRSTARTLALVALGVVSTAGLTGCYVGATRGAYYTPPRSSVYVRGSVAVGNPGYYYPATAAPDPIYEDIPPAPSYGWVWIDGYWNWGGYEWQWIPGHWEAPRANYVYVQPWYHYTGAQYVYVPGYWETRDRLPSYVRVRDRRDGRPVTGYYQSSPNYVVPSRPSHQSGYQRPGYSQPGRVVVPSQSSPSYGAPGRGRVVVPSQTSPSYGQPGRVVVPSQSSPSYGQPGRVVVPSQSNQGYGPPPSAPGRVVVPSQSNPSYGQPGRVVVPSQGPPPNHGQPGRVVVPSQGSPPPSPGRVVVPSGPPPQQSPPPARGRSDDDARPSRTEKGDGRPDYHQTGRVRER
jgi:hypothetical protein